MGAGKPAHHALSRRRHRPLRKNCLKLGPGPRYLSGGLPALGCRAGQSAALSWDDTWLFRGVHFCSACSRKAKRPCIQAPRRLLLRSRHMYVSTSGGTATELE